MFKQQDEKQNFKEVETIIGPSVKVKGNFNGQGNIIVEGIVEGNLKTSGNILIGNKSVITANVNAKEARVGGRINGNIKIKGYLEITASARISGDIECSSLSIEQGAILNGKCIMAAGGEKISKPVEKEEENK